MIREICCILNFFTTQVAEKEIAMNIRDYLPFPDLDRCRNLLCVQPHPDDNEVGAGATIAKLAKAGCRVSYLTVTDGSKGTDDPKVSAQELSKIRRKETEDAGNILGVSEFRYLNYADGSFPDEKALCEGIVRVIREIKPEIVMTVDPFLLYEVHPDHRKVGMAVAEACLLSPNIHFAEEADAGGVPKKWKVSAVAFHTTAHPNSFIGVDETWDLKIKAILAHKSQFTPQSFRLIGMYFEDKARRYAAGKDFKRAEAFKVLPPVCMHMCVDAVDL